ncbi:MAG TPA: adenylate/guanylate cyclase domain-containing protein [Pyrinomonadaceae bacterium]|nr:adenylate/guanylate cyclase domain-containing protein [Pyrinomonadaceae bacterium]
MSAVLKITEPDGRSWEKTLVPGVSLSIGRATENDVVLNDRRVSRKHAHIAADAVGFKIVDGYFENGELKRSVNHVFVNGSPMLEKPLSQGDTVVIGETRLEFFQRKEVEANVISVAPSLGNTPIMAAAAARGTPMVSVPKGIDFDDNPLGQTQMQMSANEIIGRQSHVSLESAFATAEEVKDLRRKAKTLELLYEMSKSLGTVFDHQALFDKATDLIFRGSPADRVVALLADETLDGRILDYSLNPISVKTRDEKIEALTSSLTISRTITQKVMREKIALLSQDATTDEQFLGAESIVSQGVRSTICAPLITESNVHGVIYADRLDPFAAFSPDHLELISAVAAQTAVTVETVKAHKRLAREEVARANYSRFMPEYVVKQLLDNPSSFKLGGINQKITVLFADIRGFTSISEKEKPEKVVGLLNKFFSAMTDIIFENGGTLDKYIGDGLMALFGAPTASEEDALNSVKAAVTMQKKLAEINPEFRAEGLPEISMGIGLHTGVATIGYIGSDRRSEYTAIGDTVNIASRLQSNASGGEILMSDITAEACGNRIPFTEREPLTVKNRTQPINVLEVRWA